MPILRVGTGVTLALGAAHLGDRPAPRRAVDSLQQIRDGLTAASEGYWAGEVEIERRSAVAWLVHAEGRTGDALAEMRAAVHGVAGGGSPGAAAAPATRNPFFRRVNAE
jgi:hypothetical protein